MVKLNAHGTNVNSFVISDPTNFFGESDANDDAKGNEQKHDTETSALANQDQDQQIDKINLDEGGNSRHCIKNNYPLC